MRCPPICPPAVQALVQRCLVKDRAQRIADISTARFLLTDRSLLGLAANAGANSGPGAPSPSRARRAMRWILGTAAVLVAVFGTAFAVRRLAPVAPAGTSGLARLAITLPDGDVVPEIATLVLAICPMAREW